MDKRRKIHVTILIVLSFVLIVLFSRPPYYTALRQSQLSAVELYAYAQRLTINGKIDPPCPRTRNIYVCSGYCPWTNTVNNELVSCSFLPRISNPDFVKYNIYCNPDPDHCPTYNAWLKDNLPQTRKLTTRIPDDLLSNFTLNYSIPVHYSFNDFRIANNLPAKWTVDYIDKYRSQLRKRVPYGSYNSKDIYLALDKYASLAIKDKQCAVIGSEHPWIEAALLEYKALRVTTIEYATIYSNVSRLFTITPMDFARKQQNETDRRELFDSVWSYSSLEHDGLGRYQDPLNPYGDLQTMTKITCILKPGGFVFLGLPLNINDSLEFNLHRLYGPIRLPLVYRYFHVVEVLGSEMATKEGSWVVQYFVVLQNKLGCKQS